MVRDLVVTLSAAATAGAALWGLRAWRRDQEWREHRSAALAIRRGCSRVRDGFAIVRSPLILTIELPEGSPGRGGPDANALRHVYNSRVRRLGDAMGELGVAVLEAEALWGAEIEAAMDELRRCVFDLVSAIQEHLIDAESGHIHLREPGRREKVEAAIYAARGDKDALSERIRAALGALIDCAEHHERR